MVAQGGSLTEDEERRRILYATAVIQGVVEVPADFDWYAEVAKTRPWVSMDAAASLAARVLASLVALVYQIDDPRPIVKRIQRVCNTFGGR